MITYISTNQHWYNFLKECLYEHLNYKRIRYTTAYEYVMGDHCRKLILLQFDVFCSVCTLDVSIFILVYQTFYRPLLRKMIRTRLHHNVHLNSFNTIISMCVFNVGVLFQNKGKTTL